MKIKKTSAKNLKGFILQTATGDIVFRTYENDGNFKDYNLKHLDLEVIISESSDATLYESEDQSVMNLDYSPETLGK